MGIKSHQANYFLQSTEWQIHNNKLHADITENQYNTDRMNLKHEIPKSGIDDRQNPPFSEQTKLYSEKTLPEWLQEINFVLHNWCETVALVYNYNTNIYN